MSFTKVKSLTAFIRDFYKTDEFIPLHVPRFGRNEYRYLKNAISSGQVSTTGQYIEQFEAELTNRVGSAGSVALVNGTAALQTALRVCGVSNGDEVITQALTFVATANAIAYNNAEPVFLDVDLETMGLSLNALCSFLDEFGEMRDGDCYNKETGKRIKACVPMHTFGFVGPIDEICLICRQWNIEVVEDAAEALGSTYNERHAGTFGEFGVFSFNGNKVVTAGGGGAIVSKNGERLQQVKHLTSTAKIPHAWNYFHDKVGFNHRMPNLNAALVYAQIEQLGTFLASKRDLAGEYASFCDANGLKFRQETGACRSNYWLNSIELESAEEKEYFLKETNVLGVMTRPIWTLLYEMPMYSHCFRDDQHHSKWLAERILNIPSSVPNLAS